MSLVLFVLIMTYFTSRLRAPGYTFSSPEQVQHAMKRALRPLVRSFALGFVYLLSSASAQAAPLPSGEELVERAKAMIPALKARARTCTTDRNVPAETIAEMQAANPR